MPRLLICAAALAAGLLAPVAGAAAPRVVASIEPVHALVAAVMDGLAEPRLLVSGARSPHATALKPSEAAALEAADLVVWIGPRLEGFLARPLAALAPGRDLRLIEAEGVQVRPLAHGDAGDGPEAARLDPHVWLDPDNAQAIVAAVAARLAALDPARAAAYRANAERAQAAIAAADREARALLAPVMDRPFVVFHDAYGYLERHYGLAAVAAAAPAPGRMPGARHLHAVRARIRASGARCVFREPQLAPDLAATVAAGTGARVAVLDPLGADLVPGPGAYPRLLLDLARALAGCLAPE